MKKYFLCGFFTALTVALAAQSPHSALRSGDAAYDKAQYDKAGGAYQKALEKAPTDAKAQYNLGNTLYRQGKYAEAAPYLERAAETAQSPADKADALHNLGNAKMQQQDYTGAVKAYENSLRSRPGDSQTKQNLQMAKKKLAEQQRQQQQQQQQQQNNQQPNDPPKDNQQPKDTPPQQNQPPQDKQQQQQNQQQQQQPSPPQNKPLKQSQEQMLRSAEQNDRAIKQKYQRATTNQRPIRKRKDW